MMRIQSDRIICAESLDATIFIQKGTKANQFIEHLNNDGIDDYRSCYKYYFPSFRRCMYFFTVINKDLATYQFFRAIKESTARQKMISYNNLLKKI